MQSLPGPLPWMGRSRLRTINQGNVFSFHYFSVSKGLVVVVCMMPYNYFVCRIYELPWLDYSLALCSNLSLDKKSALHVQTHPMLYKTTDTQQTSARCHIVVCLHSNYESHDMHIVTCICMLKYAHACQHAYCNIHMHVEMIL